MARVGATYLPYGLTGGRLVAAVQAHVERETSTLSAAFAEIRYLLEPIGVAVLAVLLGRILGSSGVDASAVSGAAVLGCLIVGIVRVATWSFTADRITGRRAHVYEWLFQNGTVVHDVETADLLLETFAELAPFVPAHQRTYAQLLALADEGTREEVEAAHQLMQQDVLDHRRLAERARQVRQQQEIDLAQARIAAAVPHVRARLGLPDMGVLQPVPPSGAGSLEDVQDRVPGSGGTGA